jgi:uncharacterized protein YukE
LSYIYKSLFQLHHLPISLNSTLLSTSTLSLYSLQTNPQQTINMRFSLIVVAALSAVATAQVDDFLSSIAGAGSSVLDDLKSVATSLGVEITAVPSNIESFASSIAGEASSLRSELGDVPSDIASFASSIRGEASSVRASITSVLATATGSAASSLSSALNSLDSSLNAELATVTGTGANPQSTGGAMPTALPAMGAVAVGIIGLAGFL